MSATSPARAKKAATGSGKPAKKSRRSKGEQTRRKILEAALAVIAREGTRGVTHRAVAAEASNWIEDAKGVETVGVFRDADLDTVLREADLSITKSDGGVTAVPQPALERHHQQRQRRGMPTTTTAGNNPNQISST